MPAARVLAPRGNSARGRRPVSAGCGAPTDAKPSKKRAKSEDGSEKKKKKKKKRASSADPDADTQL